MAAKAQPGTWIGVAAVALLVLYGAVLRRDSAFARYRAWLDRSSASQASIPSRWVLPRNLVATFTAGGLITMAAACIYLYFPSPTDILDELAVTRADLHAELSLRDQSAALHHVDAWERKLARLPIAARIRLLPVSDTGSRAIEQMRRELTQLRQSIESNSAADAQSTFRQINEAYSLCRLEFQQ